MYGRHCLFEDQCKNYKGDGNTAGISSCRWAQSEGLCTAKHGFIKKKKPVKAQILDDKEKSKWVLLD
jgi:hypothetical protein